MVEGSANELHPLLGHRWSPLLFDDRHSLGDSEVARLLEAARWAPSAGNSQPWGFLVVTRDDPRRTTVEARLAPSARRWAPTASALVVNAVHAEVEDSGMEFSEFAEYDLGQAAAHMTLQAQAMGLSCRQFRAFDLDGLADDLEVRSGWRIMTLTAIGRAVTDKPPRDRRPLDSLQDEPFTTAG